MRRTGLLNTPRIRHTHEFSLIHRGGGQEVSPGNASKAFKLSQYYYYYLWLDGGCTLSVFHNLNLNWRESVAVPVRPLNLKFTNPGPCLLISNRNGNYDLLLPIFSFRSWRSRRLKIRLKGGRFAPLLGDWIVKE